MICGYCNKLRQICFYITDDIDRFEPCEWVDLRDVVMWTFMTFFAILVLSWWMIPARCIQHMIQAAPNPRFYCKKNERD